MNIIQFERSDLFVDGGCQGIPGLWGYGLWLWLWLLLAIFLWSLLLAFNVARPGPDVESLVCLLYKLDDSLHHHRYSHRHRHLHWHLHLHLCIYPHAEAHPGPPSACGCSINA